MERTRIRKAGESDIDSLFQLMNEYIVDFYKKERPEEKALKSHIQFLINNPHAGLQFVAMADGQLTGFATLYFTFSTLRVKRTAILNDLFVSPEWRGKKIGENLFAHCLNYVREHHFADMTWETAKDNIAAQRLYNKMGGVQSEWIHYEIQ